MAPTTTPGSKPPVNNAAIDTPVTEPTVISTRLGGMVSVWAPVADSSATSSPGCEPRAFISGNSAGAIAAISAAFEPDNARHQVHRGNQHVGQAAAHMRQKAGQEIHHRPRHAGHLDQQAQEHEQRYRQQDQMRHAFLDPADHHDDRCRGRQRLVTEGRQPERESDGNAGEHQAGHEANKEDQQVQISEVFEGRLQQQQANHDQRARQHRAGDVTPAARFDQSQQSDCDHQGKPTGSAVARQALEISIAGVVTGISSMAKS